MITRPAAIIFDLDGTLIDSEGVWGKVFVKILNDLGIKADSDHPGEVGASTKNNWKNLIQKYNIKTEKTPEELETLSYIEYNKLIPEVELNDGVLDFLDELKDNGHLIALATLSNWETTDKILNRFDIKDFFDVITTGEEVVIPKPDPEIFNLTADKLGLEREDCLVIEDSEVGVIAAKEAGMKVIAVSDEENSKIDMADKVVESFSELKLKEIVLLF